MFNTTIVIPTKNRPIMLHRAVESISKQTLLPEKVIIIDDNSDIKIKLSDFMEFSNLDIEVLTSTRSYGGGFSRNLGINRAETNYITFLDDDDALEKTYLEEVQKELHNINLEDIALYSSKKFVLSSSLNVVFKKIIVTNIIKTENLLTENSVGTTSCVTISKQLLENIKGFDKNLPAFQDYDCWLRLSFNNVIFYPVEKAFIYYTINENSNQISANFNNHIDAREKILKKFKTKISNKSYAKLKVTLSFFVAKAIHRKNYFFSLQYSVPIILGKIKAIAFILPYKLLNKFGVYTS